MFLLPLGDTAGQDGVGLDEELPEERSLPVGPHLWSYGVDVQIGEEVEHPEKLLVLHLPGEFDDQPLVVQVPPLGDVRHVEVLGDQERDGGDVSGR